MKKLLLLLLLFAPALVAQTGAVTGFCNTGAQQAAVSGLQSTNYQQGVIPFCTVSVYQTGTTTLATIYADKNNTPLANPFTATTTGQWLFFAANGAGVDVTLSGGVPPNIYSQPVTIPGLYPSQQITVTAQAAGTTSQAQYNNNGALGGSLLTLDAPGNLNTPGSITAATSKADAQRTGTYWFDARSKGVQCGYDGSGNPIDNTTSLQSMVTASNFAGVQFTSCGNAGPMYFNPGASTGSAALLFSGTNQYSIWAGRGRDFQATLQDMGSNSSSAPMLQIGDGLKYQQNVNLRDMAFYGAGNATLSVLTGGSGCAAGTNIATSGGSGSGMTVSQLVVNSGAVLSAAIYVAGSGYANGDVITSAQGGCVGMTFRYNLIGSTTVLYPNGMVRYASSNLEGMDNVSIKNFSASTGNIGLTNATGGSFPLFGEMAFNKLQIFMSLSDTDSIAAKLLPPNSNTAFNDSNLEACTECLMFTGSLGTPILQWNGGHIERVGFGRSKHVGDAFYIEQAQAFIHGALITGGNVWLGSSVFGSDISYGGMQQGYFGFYSDNGLGNRIHVGAVEHQGQPTDMSGAEWYLAYGNVVPDPTFTISGSTGWTATNATVLPNSLPSPGAPSGRSLVITPTADGGYISKSFTVSTSSDYQLTMAFYMTPTTPNAQVQLYNQSSTLVYDSGSFTLANAAPVVLGTVSPNGWRMLRHWLPAGPTTYTVRIIGPNNGANVQVAFLSITPSVTTMSTNTLAGTAACSGSGLSYACSMPGSGGSGASVSSVQWQPSSSTPVTTGFLQFHVTTDSQSVWPVCYWGAGTANGAAFTLVANTSRDYTIPISNANASTGLTCEDFYGPTGDATDMIVSNVSVIPINQGQAVTISSSHSGSTACATPLRYDPSTGTLWYPASPSAGSCTWTQFIGIGGSLTSGDLLGANLDGSKVNDTGIFNRNVMQKCGSSTFTASTTGSAVPCSWVTASSHCEVSWTGSLPGTAVNLGYTPSSASVLATASASTTGTASIACSQD